MAFTHEQLEAINKEGSNIIVSAGAGSGKTAVLTQRVIRKLTSGVDIDKILVLTFTNEAAGEMKNRIRDAIIKNGLNNQLSLLDSSYITTFDSYAYSLVKKYHYILNMSPNVSIIDSNIINIYKYKVLEEIFMSYYEKKDDKFIKLINDFCIKDDSQIKEYIIEMSNKLDELLDKKTYLDNYINNFYSDDFVNNIIKRYNDLINTKINKLLEVYNDLKYYITDSLDKKLYDYFNPIINGNSYEEYHNIISKQKVRMVGVSPEGLKIKEELKTLLEELCSYLEYNNLEEIKERLISTKDYAYVFVEILKELNEKVISYKKEKDIYEFNDIAHYAIEIVEKNPNIRNEIKEYFNEIMLDEYQDTSIIQEKFINLISNNNVYMVGDIKQSIYRFRNANPYIFREKYNSYSINNGGYKIDLLKNFRSRKETLYVINEIFNQIMDEEIGDAKYLESHNMIYGNTDYDKEDTKANNYLEIYNYNNLVQEEFKDYEKELFIVSADINRKIKEKYKVFDKETKELRNIKYSDICIITDRNKYLDTYKKILEYNGIPCVLYKDEELTSDADILVIKNLLNLIVHIKENTYDTKFKYLYTSVARSYLFEYSDNKIYKTLKDNNYKTDEIIKLCKEIDIYIPLEQLINEVLEKFNVYEKLTILNNIKESIERINNLKEIARSLNKLDYSLKDFIEYFEKSLELGLNIKYSVNTKGENAIKIMNIHKSKGLEFSLCYFTGMKNKFAIKDITKKILFDEELGIILPSYNNEFKDTILKDLYKEKFYREEISEKIRLFYVALTRCREKMIIVASLNEEREPYNGLVPNSTRISYMSFLDILNSISCIDKYVIAKEGEYTKEYNDTKLTAFTNQEEFKIEKRINKLKYDKEEKEHFSKKITKILTKDEINKMEYGTNIHEIFEYSNFKKSNNININNLINQIESNYINIYKEYEFIDNETHGIIDLLLEYENHYVIIDYKLKNINDLEYIKQLTGYKKYIEKLTSKYTDIYLYSINDNKLKKI